MKRLLISITLVVTTATVIVLAIYLVLIAAALIRANRNLTRLAGGLEAIRDNTAPLGRDLGAINGAAVTLRERLAAVEEHLAAIVPRVGARSS